MQHLFGFLGNEKQNLKFIILIQVVSIVIFSFILEEVLHRVTI